MHYAQRLSIDSEMWFYCSAVRLGRWIRNLPLRERALHRKHYAQKLSKLSGMFMKTEKHYAQWLSKVSEWEGARKVESEKSKKSGKPVSGKISDYENHYAQRLSKVSEWLGKFESSKMREFESGKTLDPAVAGPASWNELQNFRTCIQRLSKVSEWGK